MESLITENMTTIRAHRYLGNKISKRILKKESGLRV